MIRAEADAVRRIENADRAREKRIGTRGGERVSWIVTMRLTAKGSVRAKSM